jgi:hypothetical protein
MRPTGSKISKYSVSAYLKNDHETVQLAEHRRRKTAALPLDLWKDWLA